LSQELTDELLLFLFLQSSKQSGSELVDCLGFIERKVRVLSSAAEVAGLAPLLQDRFYLSIEINSGWCGPRVAHWSCEGGSRTLVPWSGKAVEANKDCQQEYNQECTHERMLLSSAVSTKKNVANCKPETGSEIL
jgi:hypothetical protein